MQITSSKTEIVEALTQAGARFDGTKVFCPYHQNDNTPAGSIYEQGGHWRYRCFACGASGDATDLKAMQAGGTVADVIKGNTNPRNGIDRPLKALTGEQAKPSGKPEPLEAIRASIKGKITHQHAYYDNDGELIGLIIRYKTDSGKSFLPLTAHGDLFVIGAMPKPRPLYNLPAVSKADMVVIVEGEKCVDSLTAYGIISTTGSGGSNSAKATDWKPLAGKKVIAWRDNDTAGEKYVSDVKAQLAGLNCEIYEINPSELDLQEKEDCADYINQLEVAYGDNSEKIKTDIQAALDKAKPVSEFGEIEPFGNIDLPEIDLDCLPPDWDWLRTFCRECERILGTPSGVALLLALTVIGTAAADKYRVNFRKRPDWFEVLGLFAMPFLPTGSKKTDLMRILTEPLKAHERDFNEQHKNIIAENQRRRRILEGRIAKLEKDLINGKSVNELELDRLTFDLATFTDMHKKIVFTQNITAENIAHVLEKNSTHINFDTEGSMLANLFGRYSQNKGDMRIELVLDSYSGAHLRINRVGRSTVDIQNPRLSIALLTQRATFDSMPRMDYLADKGFLGRFLYYAPDVDGEIEEFEAQEFNPDVYGHYDWIVKALFGMPSGGDMLLYMNSEAEQLFGDYFKEVSRRMLPEGDLYPIITWAKKMRGNVARIIGILHLAQSRDNNTEIDIQTVQAGIAIGEVLAAHAKAIFGGITESPEEHLAKRVLKWVRRHKLSDFSKRDLYQGLKDKQITAEDLEKPLAILVERGYILPIQDNREGVGRKSEPYIVNPKIKKYP